MSVDVCIVGGGVAGAVTAHRLAANGKSVVLLDAGPRFKYPDPERYAGLRRGISPWEWEDPERDRCEEASDPPIRLNRNRIKAVGGTTLHWNATTLRLQPDDFKMHSLHGVGVDWPFDYDELEPWYSQAEEELGVAGGEMVGAPPMSRPYPLPGHPLSHAAKNFIVPAFADMGLAIGETPHAVNSRPHNGRPACAAFTTCIPMCPIHAKYTGMAHIFKGEATGKVLVKHGCHVRRLSLAGGRKVGAVQYVAEDGNLHEQHAKAFILAGGAVEVPRLLLLSGEGSLANSSGLVGRNFMTHPRVRVSGRMPENIGPHRSGLSTCLSWALYQHEKLPETGNVLLAPAESGGGGPADLAKRTDFWNGEKILEEIQNEFGRGITINIQGDMLPKKENRVSLSSTREDKYGDPIPRIEMKLSQVDRNGLARGVQVSEEAFRRMKATDIAASSVEAVGNHLMGTTRMGASPEESVCDPWGRCHELDNLYVVSSSLFPTGGCSSPTLTIAALGLRTGDYLSRNL